MSTKKKSIEKNCADGRKIIFHLDTDDRASFAIFREDEQYASTHFVHLNYEEAQEFAKAILTCKNVTVA